MLNYKNCLLGTICFCSVFALSTGEEYTAFNSAGASIGISSAPVDLQADKLENNEGGQVVTASGDVILKQDGRTVKADKIVYNLKEDTVFATGNVEFIDVTGDQHLAERFEFSNSLKDGFVEGLKSLLVDGSRFTASNGQHINGNKTIMKDAHYTPCKTCKDNPDEEPLWQIRASEVEHDKEKKSVVYRNARFEVKGVPVAYFPYFSHPDGSVKKKNGFLTPRAGYKSDLGAFVESRYYYSLSPSNDMTFGVMAMTQDSPLANMEWRQRWEKASLYAFGSLTYSQRTDEEAGVEVNKDRELRGHLKADGLWDINNKWRSGIRVNVASDDQYLRQYDFDNDDDVLENELYVERFSGRNYASGRVVAFQDIRVDESIDEDQPNILPEIDASFIGKPGSMPVIGGRLSARASLLGLLRDNDEQDVNRGHAELGWQRRLISDFGLVSVLNANLQGSIYNVNDRTGYKTNSSIDGNSTEARGFGYIDMQSSYPVAKNLDNSQLVIEPLVSVMLAPDIDTDDIPNEDSQDVQIDGLGLFNASRFPGIDGVEDRSRMTYGVRTGIYSDDGSYGNLFVGQSYSFEDDDSPFAIGSGLNDQSSDIVGELKGAYKDLYSLDYRFQLDNESLSSQRHEVDASARISNLKLSARYLFAKTLENSDDDETREQIYNSASYYINDNWRLYGAARHDLGDDPGLRKANLGVAYTGQCISWSLVGERTLTDDSSGDSGTDVFLRLGFKNLGEFQAQGLQVGGGNE